jgi:hypothetical protein
VFGVTTMAMLFSDDVASAYNEAVEHKNCDMRKVHAAISTPLDDFKKTIAPLDEKALLMTENAIVSGAFRYKGDARCTVCIST